MLRVGHRLIRTGTADQLWQKLLMAEVGRWRPTKYKLNTKGKMAITTQPNDSGGMCWNSVVLFTRSISQVEGHPT